MRPDIEEQLKAIPKDLPLIVPDSTEFLALTSPEATADPNEMMGKVAKYNEEVKWYNDRADRHGRRLTEYKQNAGDPAKSSFALETYTAVRIGTTETTGLALSLHDVNAAYRDIEELMRPGQSIPAAAALGSALKEAGTAFEHSQEAFQRLQSQVALDQARLKDFRALQGVADGQKPKLMEQLTKLNAFGELKKPLSVDNWTSQTRHGVIGRHSRMKGIDAPLGDLNDKLTGLEELVKENPRKLERFTQDLVQPNRSKEYGAYLQGLEQQHAATEKAWNTLREVVATQDQSGKVRGLDKPAINNLYGTLQQVGTESFVAFPQALRDAKRMVEGLNQAIVAERAQQELQAQRAQVRAQLGRDLQAVVQAPAAQERAAGRRGQEELELIEGYNDESPTTPTRPRQISDASASIRIGMSRAPSPSPQRREPLPSRFSADSTAADVDPDAKVTRTHSSFSKSPDRSRRTSRSGPKR
jgi:hypothetical protein